jgi:uncharacterized membrane protein YeaQ/YmgE (transglycosylase-associated protein family)
MPYGLSTWQQPIDRRWVVAPMWSGSEPTQTETCEADRQSRAVAGVLGRRSRQYLTEVEKDMIGFLIAGLVIGALARAIKPGKQDLSLTMTLLLGLAGSVIGGVIANVLGTGGIWELNILGFIVAVVSAVALIGVFEGLSGRRSRSSIEGDRRYERI